MFNERILNQELNKIVGELEGQVKANDQVIKENLQYLTKLLSGKTFKDKEPEEVINKLFEDVTRSVSKFMQTYNLIPGINVSSKVSDVRMNINAGYKDYTKKEKLTNEHSFNIASITKTPTAIIIYQLMEEGILSPNERMNQIVPEFSNLTDEVTVSMVTGFASKFETNGRLDDANLEEAKRILNTVCFKKEPKEEYRYSDIPSMMLARVIEEKTGMNYFEAVQKRIIEPYTLQNTFLGGHVSDDKKNLLTGSQNVDKGLPNDPKANALGGIYGHAGMFINTHDIMTIMENLIDGNFFKFNISDFYRKNPGKSNRAISGQAIIPNEYYESLIIPYVATGAQGSTRTSATAGIFNIRGKRYRLSNAILSNAASVDPEILKRIAEEKNIKVDNLYKYYPNTDTYRVDIRQIAKATCLDEIMQEISKFELNVAVLQAFIKAYDPNYTISMDETISLDQPKTL